MCNVIVANSGENIINVSDTEIVCHEHEDEEMQETVENEDERSE